VVTVGPVVKDHHLTQLLPKIKMNDHTNVVNTIMTDKIPAITMKKRLCVEEA